MLAYKNRPLHISTAANLWAMVFQDSLPNPYKVLIRERLEEYPAFPATSNLYRGLNLALLGTTTNLKEYQFYLLGDWEAAENGFLALRETTWQTDVFPYQNAFVGLISPWVEAMLGCIYARQGKHEQALAQIDKLEQMRASIPEKHSPSFKGFVSYWQGKIYAILGEKEQAVQHLQQAIEEGKVMAFGAFRMDWDLASLRGYEPYERLLGARE